MFWESVRVGVSQEQFKQMQQRVGGPKRVALPVLSSSHKTTANRHDIILGVDPSLRGTGFGVIRPAKPQPRWMADGTVHCPAGWERSRCLARIHETIREVVQKHHPSICVIEGLFYAQNLQTALIMGEARGAALAAIAGCGLEIVEMAPRKVKQAIVGYGAAQKLAVAKMVQRLLGLAEPPEPDAADALALALAYSQEQSRYTFAAPKRI